jgi:copper chaperone CopZ
LYFLAQAQGKTETAVIKTMIYCDHCMQCESCSGKLEHELFFKKGITEIKLDEKAMTVTVTYKPEKITLDAIREAISKLGFDADDVKADLTAYNKLDACCKKPE